MQEIIDYAYEYVKTGKGTLFLLLTCLALTLPKYLFKNKIPSVRLLFPAILLLGILLRLGWLEYSSHTLKFEWAGYAEGTIQEHDLITIHAAAINKGIWFEDAAGNPSGRRPIGYPVFLAAIFYFLGASSWVVWLTQLALWCVSAFFLYKMAELLWGSGSQALLALFWFAVYPISIYSVKLATDEHLFLPLWYAGLYLLFREISGKRVPLAWLWYGVIFGYATMTRTHTIFMPVIVAWSYFLLKRGWSRAVLSAFLILFTMQAINVPWVIRNYRAWGVPVLYSATGYFVYAQVNSTAKAKGDGHVPHPGEEGYSAELAAALSNGNEGLQHQISNRLMKEWILANPVRFGFMGVARLLYFMNFNREAGVWPLWYQFYSGSYVEGEAPAGRTKKTLEEYAFHSYYVLFFLTVLSLALFRRLRLTLTVPQKVMLMTLLMCFLLYLAEHFIIYPARKYRYPLEPLMMVLCVPLIHSLVARFRWEVLWKQILTQVQSLRRRF